MINRTRFSDLIGREVLYQGVLMVGAGSVGSNLARALSSIGVRDIVVCDHDTVGDENIAVSWLEGIGVPKVEDIAERAERLYGTNIVPVEDEVNSIRVADIIADRDIDVVVVSTDNIESRREVWDGVKYAEDAADILYIDFRIGGYSGNVFSFYVGDERSVELYEATFKNRGVGLPCGAKAYPGLTLGWCPMTLIDIVGRHIRKSLIPYHRSAHLDTSYNEPEFMISRSDI